MYYLVYTSQNGKVTAQKVLDEHLIDLNGKQKKEILKKFSLSEKHLVKSIDDLIKEFPYE